MRMTSEDYEGAHAYQLNLFATFDIDVLFAERLAWIDNYLVAHADKLDPTELGAEGWAEICPLELRKKEITRTCFDDRLWPLIKHSACCEYVYVVPFRGDRELWYLRPTIEAPAGPDGEIHRHNLIIGMLGHSGNEAGRQFRQSLRRIEQLIELQNREIAAFEARLAGIVKAKVEQMRALRRWNASGGSGQ